MAADANRKSDLAFRTIGELAADLGVPQHILRYWETRFTQLRPLQRAGNRRYYRPADVELARRIHRLLSSEGYTVRGVQKMLRDGSSEPAPAAAALTPVDSGPAPAMALSPSLDLDRLRDLRNRLADALDG